MQYKKALILITTGSPDVNSITAIKSFLKLFLSDKHVIHMQSFIWKPILHGIILKKRPQRLLLKYQKITIDNKSPLTYYTEKLIDKLQEKLADTKVISANLYAPPLIEDTFTQLKQKGIDDITCIPLFAQFSTVTTQAIIDRVNLTIKNLRFELKKFRFIRDYYSHPLYIQALCRDLQKFTLNSQSPLILAYHSLPQSYLKDNLDYVKQCMATSSAIGNYLNCTKNIKTVFVSRFGKGKWLSPNLEDTVNNLIEQKITSINIMAPGFMTDCIETFYDVKESAQYIADKEGISFNYLPSLNDCKECVDLLLELYINLEN